MVVISATIARVTAVAQIKHTHRQKHDCFDLQASRLGKKREDGAVSGATLVSVLCCKETTRPIHPLHTKPSWHTNADARPKANKRQSKQWNPAPVKRHAPTAGLRRDRHSAAFMMSQIEAWVSQSSYIDWQWRASVPTHGSGREQWAERLTYGQIYLFCFFKTWKITTKKEPFSSYIIAPSPRGIGHSCVIVGVSTLPAKDSHMLSHTCTMGN